MGGATPAADRAQTAAVWASAAQAQALTVDTAAHGVPAPAISAHAHPKGADGASSTRVAHVTADVHTDVLAPAAAASPTTTAAWTADAQKELQKIPFFVRGKAHFGR
jgi:hypothetical protein